MFSGFPGVFYKFNLSKSGPSAELYGDIRLAEGALYIGVIGALIIYGREYGFRKR